MTTWDLGVYLIGGQRSLLRAGSVFRSCCAVVGATDATTDAESHVLLDASFDGATLRFTATAAPDLQIIGFLPRLDVERFGATRLSDLLLGLGRGLGMGIGRSFREDMYATPVMQEITHGVECVEWFNYYGPSLAARYVDRIEACKTVFRNDAGESGDLCLVTSASPFAENLGLAWRACMAALGETARPYLMTIERGVREKVNLP